MNQALASLKSVRLANSLACLTHASSASGVGAMRANLFLAHISDAVGDPFHDRLGASG